MSNIFFKSLDTDEMLNVYCHEDGTIVIHVEVKDSDNVWVSLNEITAIQFSKELRKQIAKAKEVQNG